MKNFILILFLSLGFAFHGIAQDGEGKGKGNKLEALKVAYLTQKLNLSTEEAQRFWPIYNSYTSEIRKIRQEQKEKNLPEIDAEDKILNVRKRYNGELSKALSADKANTFFRSEKEFGGYIQRELQERRMNRQLNKQRPFRQ
jgi:hypothetical protein